MVEFVHPLQDILVKQLPTTSTFECELSKTVNVQWYKGDQPIRRSHKYKTIQEGYVHKLVIKDVDGKDEGDYTIIAKDTKSKAYLTINGKFITLV